MTICGAEPAGWPSSGTRQPSFELPDWGVSDFAAPHREGQNSRRRGSSQAVGLASADLSSNRPAAAGDGSAPRSVRSGGQTSGATRRSRPPTHTRCPRRPHRKQLAELLAVPDDQVDLARAALLIAAIDNPEIEVADSLQTLDDLANDFQKLVSETTSETERLEAFHKFLFDEQGFHGSRVNYYNPSNSYLNETIDDREGLPITLSILYMTIAKRAGFRTEGVGLPGHFVVRVIPKEGEPLLVDPFERGQKLTISEAEALVKESGREWMPQLWKLKPCGRFWSGCCGTC